MIITTENVIFQQTSFLLMRRSNNGSNSLFSEIDAIVHFKVVNEEDGESHDRLIDGPRY